MSVNDTVTLRHWLGKKKNVRKVWARFSYICPIFHWLDVFFVRCNQALFQLVFEFCRQLFFISPWHIPKCKENIVKLYGRPCKTTCQHCLVKWRWIVKQVSATTREVFLLVFPTFESQSNSFFCIDQWTIWRHFRKVESWHTKNTVDYSYG